MTSIHYSTSLKCPWWIKLHKSIFLFNFSSTSNTALNDLPLPRLLLLLLFQAAMSSADEEPSAAIVAALTSALSSAVSAAMAVAMAVDSKADLSALLDEWEEAQRGPTEQLVSVLNRFLFFKLVATQMTCDVRASQSAWVCGSILSRNPVSSVCFLQNIGADWERDGRVSQSRPGSVWWPSSRWVLDPLASMLHVFHTLFRKMISTTNHSNCSDFCDSCVTLQDGRTLTACWDNSWRCSLWTMTSLMQ